MYGLCESCGETLEECARMTMEWIKRETRLRENRAQASRRISSPNQGGMHPLSTEVDTMGKILVSVVNVFSDGSVEVVNKSGAVAAAAPSLADVPVTRVDVPNGFLKKGSTGEDVSKLQACLKKLNFVPLTVGDGDRARFGDVTEARLIEFQEKFLENGLSPDGKYGKNTKAALVKALSAAGL